MKKANFILSGMCIALAIYVISVASSYPAGSNGVPGPGVFPIIISAVMIASSLSIILSSIRMKDEKIVWINENIKPVYISMAAVVIYTLALAKIGFIVTSIIFVTAMIQWFKKGNPLINAVISTAFVVIVYIVFSVVLKVPMDFGFLI